MPKQSEYQSKRPDASGYIKWSHGENTVWRALFEQQMALLPNRACDEYFAGIERLQLNAHAIPQLPQIDEVLYTHTGWKTAAVDALISFERFFTLLANKQFPVATFIRSEKDFAYLQEPDIFHEVMGHCPLLTNPAFAAFTETYGKLGLHASKEDRVYLARLYWFTVEFGLVHQANGLRILGGGILSSPKETVHALEGDSAIWRNLVALDALRTPYRIDILQPLYYVLPKFSELLNLAGQDLMSLVSEAKHKGLFSPLFAPKSLST